MEGPFVRVASDLPLSNRQQAPIAFLDRDGVINIGRPGYINTPSEVDLLEGAATSIASLRRAGFLVCVVTNQSPIARGLWGADRLELIHRSLQSKLLEADPDAHVDAFITCPHRFEDRCGCRKPSPAMLMLGHRLLRTESVSLEADVLENAGRQAVEVDWWGEQPVPPNPLDAMVGDRRSDMGAGWAYGARLFRVNGRIGVDQVIQRVVNGSDGGDDFQP